MANGRGYSVAFLAGQMSEVRGRLSRVELMLWGLVAGTGTALWGIAMLYFRKAG